jgi:peptidoglycan hydrolase-like protein with peptidoglycan-binding domain
MTWKLHLKIKYHLEKYGIEVITTRKNQNEKLDLTARGKAAKGCNLFLSIHSNAAGNKINESVDYPIAFVPINGSADDLGKQLAECIWQTVSTKQKGRSEAKKSTKGNWDYYSVINGAASVGVPGIILEHSFHTNTKSTKWLMDDNNLDTLAKAEAEIIARYFKIIEKETDTTITLNLPILMLDAKNTTVEALQILLIGYGYSCGKAGVDGWFGINTANALKAYQEHNKLISDGICGIKSWQSLLGLK